MFILLIRLAEQAIAQSATMKLMAGLPQHAKESIKYNGYARITKDENIFGDKDLMFLSPLPDSLIELGRWLNEDFAFTKTMRAMGVRQAQIEHFNFWDIMETLFIIDSDYDEITTVFKNDRKSGKRTRY